MAGKVPKTVLGIKKRKWWRRSDTDYLLLSLPTVVWYFCFWFMPLFGIIVAFKQFRITPGAGFLANLFGSPWVGLQNFQGLFSYPNFGHIVALTVTYNVVFISLGVTLPVVLALIVSEVKQKTAAKVYQTIIFLPNFLSMVVIGMLVWTFLDYNKGIANQVLVSIMGQERVIWYGTPSFWPPFLVALSEWKGLGFASVVYLAAITSLDKEVFEAAVIDGATKRQQIWYITLPLLKRIIVLMLIMSVGGLFGSDFGLFYIVPRMEPINPLLLPVTETVGVLVYRMLKGSPIGQSSAAGLLSSVIGCALVLSANAIVRKVDNESAMV
jgi:putative aldouronate transport system permease protein